jgi:hypothetical protein
MRLQRLNPGYVSAGSLLSLSKAIHDGKIILLDSLSGSVVTLPPALGTGAQFDFIEKVAATTNSHIIKVANSVDVMIGTVVLSITAGGAANAYATVAASDTITLNRTTTGGATNGAKFSVRDVAPGIWSVEGCANASATPATPFSASV